MSHNLGSQNLGTKETWACTMRTSTIQEDIIDQGTKVGKKQSKDQHVGLSISLKAIIPCTRHLELIRTLQLVEEKSRWLVILEILMPFMTSP